MRALLIDAQGAGSVGRAVLEWIPAGLRAIAGILESFNCEYELLSAESFLRRPELARDCDIAFASAMSSDFEAVRWVGERLSELSMPFILGGPVTFEPERAVLEAKAEIAVIGEGESACTKLMELGLKDGVVPESAALEHVEGIAYRDGSGKARVSRGSRYLSKEELNRFFPSVELIERYPFHRDVMVVMEILRGCSNFHKPKVYHSRECDPGCGRCESPDLTLRLTCPLGTPGGCGFCSVGGLYGPPRSKDQTRVLKELKGLIDHGATKIAILDPDPLDYKREELVAPMPLTDPAKPMPNYEEIEKLGEMMWALPEVADEEVVVTVRDVKATLVTDRSVELLKRYFPRSVFGIGCETGSRWHSIRLGRPYGPEEVVRAVKVFHRHGVKPKINMIAGLPWQSEETTRETLEFMDAVEPYISHFDFTRFESLPMSGLDDHPSDTGPVRDENTRRLLQRSNALQRRLLQRFVGERMKVVVGRYPVIKQEGGHGPERAPRRGFRSLAGLVGYPIFDRRQLSLYATIIRIHGGDSSLRTGDVAIVEVTGVSQLGFRLVLEGSLTEQTSS